MNDKQEYELKVIHSRQKSFYGKAMCMTYKDVVALKSYNTVVVAVNTDTGAVYFPWRDHSRTTAKHVKEFLMQLDIYDKALSVMAEKKYKSFAQFMRQCANWNYKE